MNDDGCGDDVEYEDKDNNNIDDNSSLTVQIQIQRQEKTMIAKTNFSGSRRVQCSWEAGSDLLRRQREGQGLLEAGDPL